MTYLRNLSTKEGHWLFLGKTLGLVAGTCQKPKLVLPYCGGAAMGRAAAPTCLRTVTSHGEVSKETAGHSLLSFAPMQNR